MGSQYQLPGMKTIAVSVIHRYALVEIVESHMMIQVLRIAPTQIFATSLYMWLMKD